MVYKEFGATIAPANTSETGFPIAMLPHIAGSRVTDDLETIHSWQLLGEGSTLALQKAAAIGQIWYVTAGTSPGHYVLKSWTDTDPTWERLDKDMATEDFVNDKISEIPSPMIFKGTIGTEGTVTTLPTADTSTGFTYKVITDATYSSIPAKVGDLLISNGAAWVLIPSGDDLVSVATENTIGGIKSSGDLSVDSSTGVPTVKSVNIVGSLPTTGNFDGRQVTYQGRSYIWNENDSAWKCDSDTLGGFDSDAFATHDHNHDSAYLGITATATNSDKLGGESPSYYEPAFTKKTAFNEDFGTGNSDVARGDHGHTDLHSHDNKDILDDITAAFTTELETSYDSAVTNSHTHVDLDALDDVSGVNTGDETTLRIGTLINGATEKTTLKDADMVGLMDSETTNKILKKLSWSNIKATLKDYFDIVYSTLSFGRIKVGAVDVVASRNSTIELLAGTNVTLTADNTAKTIEIAATGGGGGIQTVTLASGTNNGTLKLTVDSNTIDNIPVKGLGSAAYKDTSYFATAAQGDLADSALQSGDDVKEALGLIVNAGYNLQDIFKSGLSTPSTNNFNLINYIGSYRVNGDYLNAPNQNCGTNTGTTYSMEGTLNVFRAGNYNWELVQQLFWGSEQYQRYSNGTTFTDWKRLIKCDDYAGTGRGGIISEANFGELFRAPDLIQLWNINISGLELEGGATYYLSDLSIDVPIENSIKLDGGVGNDITGLTSGRVYRVTYDVHFVKDGDKGEGEVTIGIRNAESEELYSATDYISISETRKRITFSVLLTDIETVKPYIEVESGLTILIHQYNYIISVEEIKFPYFNPTPH